MKCTIAIVLLLAPLILAQTDPPTTPPPATDLPTPPATDPPPPPPPATDPPPPPATDPPPPPATDPPPPPPTTQEPEPVLECIRAGALCETCSNLVTCVATGEGGWEKHPNQNCATIAGRKCLQGECVIAPDPKCDGLLKLPFKCKSVGIFPDPFDCTEFYMCVTNGNALQAFKEVCEPGFGYNIANGLCDIQLKAGKCTSEYPLPVCKNSSDHGALVQKRAMYYICERYDEDHDVLYPFLYVCKGGTTFHPDYTCY